MYIICIYIYRIYVYVYTYIEELINGKLVLCLKNKKTELV